MIQSRFASFLFLSIADIFFKFHNVSFFNFNHSDNDILISVLLPSVVSVKQELKLAGPSFYDKIYTEK